MTYKERLIELLQHSPTDAMGNHGVGAMADHLMDNGLVFKEMYDDIEERLAHQRARATTAEHFICKLCAECDYEDKNGITTMILKCCSMFPECGKFKIRSGWIPVTERLPEKYTEVIAFSPPYSDYLIGFVDVAEDEKSVTCFGDGVQLHNVTHWMHLPEPPTRENT